MRGPIARGFLVRLLMLPVFLVACTTARDVSGFGHFSSAG